MALIACPECGKQVSTAAQACPACGFPLAENSPAVPATVPETPPAVVPNELLLEVRPSWWTFGWHLFFFWLIIPLLIAIYRRLSYVMRVYTDRVSVEEGFWSKDSSEFFIKDIRAIDVRQGIWGRMVGIGDLTISTAATVDAAEEARGMPAPHRIKDLLIAQRQQISP